MRLVLLIVALFLLGAARALGAGDSVASTVVELHALYQGGAGTWHAQETLSGATSAGPSNVSVSTRLFTFVRSATQYSLYAPGSSAITVVGASIVSTSRDTNGNWRLCRWAMDATGMIADSSHPPTCSSTAIAPGSSGTPTSMVYLGSFASLILVAFPEAGDIIAVSSGTLAAWPNKWATDLAAPVSMAFDSTADLVYVALLNDDSIVRFDPSGILFDPPERPFVSVYRPRFVLTNLAVSGGSSGTPSFYVMSSDATAAELFTFDANGASVGTSQDLSSEWVCDEPGSQPSENDSIARIVDIGIDASGVLYVIREGGYNRIDSYNLNGNASAEVISHVLLNNPLAFLFESGHAQPEGLVDSYAVQVGGSVNGIFLQCAESYASGSTLPVALGVWPCGYGAYIYYDARSVYVMDVDSITCFRQYLFLLDGAQVLDEGLSIKDTFLSADRTIHVLLSDGRHISIAQACIKGPHNVTIESTPLPPPLMSIPNHDFFVYNGLPCVSTQSELACAGGLNLQGVPVCQQQTSGEPLEGVAVLYSEKHASLFVTGWHEGLLYVEQHEIVANGTMLQESCGGPYINVPQGSAFLLDSASGVLGFVSLSDGVLYEYNPERDDFEQVGKNGTTIPPSAGSFGWTLVDPMGPNLRYPAGPTTAPPATRKPSNRGELPTGLVVALVIISVFLCLLVYLAYAYVRARRAEAKNGAHHDMPGAGAVSYESTDGPIEDDPRLYTLSPQVRKWIRLCLCPFDCCYRADGRLLCCFFCLGGWHAKSRRAYAQMQEPEVTETGEPLPEVAPPAYLRPPPTPAGTQTEYTEEVNL